MNPFAIGAISSAALTAIGFALMHFGGVVKTSSGVPWAVIAVLSLVSLALWLVILFRRDGGAEDARVTLLLGFLCAAPTFGLLLWAGTSATKSARAKELAAAGIDVKLGEYMSAATANPTEQPERRIAGKVVVIDVGERAFSELHFKLPPELKPASAAEVGTVVHLLMSERTVGSYTNGAVAKQWVAEVKFIDLASHEVWYRGEVAGTQPPSSTKSKSSVSGSKPDARIVELITNLARK